MRLIKFLRRGRVCWGAIEGERVMLLKESPFKKIRLSKESLKLKSIKRFLPPAQPTKIILVGLNYRDHARELGMKIPKEPLIFLKPTTSLVGNNGDIVYPWGVKRLDYEAELALVVKKRAKNLTFKSSGDYILGYTCLNDVTARDIQKKDGQWTRAKSFDTFCPVGPWLETCLDPSSLKIRSYLNGKLKQDSTTKNFIFSPQYLLYFIPQVMTLNEGDIISTGTPPGVGPMKIGDIIEIEIEGIGILRNRVSVENSHLAHI